VGEPESAPESEVDARACGPNNSPAASKSGAPPDKAAAKRNATTPAQLADRSPTRDSRLSLIVGGGKHQHAAARSHPKACFASGAVKSHTFHAPFKMKKQAMLQFRPTESKLLWDCDCAYTPAVKIALPS
jgi:hypothetical protein